MWIKWLYEAFQYLYTLMLPRQKRRGRCSSKDGLAGGPLSLQTSLQQLSLCGMNWINQSEKRTSHKSAVSY
ncbi:hypothetical protein L3Q82_023679 [Scortum barcoo]|uniref:Uncharacterized protein n=1 Tax=Scortum barcoo TaxID=214431 RepID=A0ACB8WWI6_9TELE|nr:hypothetical protein L3Q82_023679 [Scortum barcoo]